MIKDNDPPILPPDSPGSSISSRFQDEYNELIRNAVVLPNGNFQIRSNNQKNALIFEKTPPKINDSITEDLIDLESSTRKMSSERDFQRREEKICSNSCQNSYSPNRRTNSNESRISTSFLPTNFDSTPINDKMDNWYLDLKKNLMNEFEELKQKFIEENEKSSFKEKKAQAEEFRRLNEDVKTMRQMLIEYENLLDKKDQTEENLCKAVDLLYQKTKVYQNFYRWRLRTFEEQQENYALALAKRFYEDKLKRKILSNWKFLSEREWKKRFERACEEKSKAILESLLDDFEEKFRDFETKIRESNEEIFRLKSEKSVRDEVIKKAFMRGVCALNVEAMSVLLKDQSRPEPPLSFGQFSSGDFSANENLSSSTPAETSSDEVSRHRFPLPVENVSRRDESNYRETNRRRFASKRSPIFVHRHFSAPKVRS